MACTIDPTIGGASANSYASIAQADAYHAAHLYAAVWTAAAEDTKCQALQMATRVLNTMVEWHGEVVSGTQSLLWPRYDVRDARGLWVESDELPTELVNATAELARQLMSTDTTADSEIEVQGLTSLKVGPVSLDFAGAVGRPMPDAVFYMVAHLGTLKQRGGATSVKLGRA